MTNKYFYYHSLTLNINVYLKWLNNQVALLQMLPCKVITGKKQLCSIYTSSLEENKILSKIWGHIQ